MHTCQDINYVILIMYNHSNAIIVLIYAHNLFKMKNEKYFFQENCTYVHRKPKSLKNKAKPYVLIQIWRLGWFFG